MTEAVPPPGVLLEGKYKIIGVVGEGAWGQVLEGINVRIQRKVAIKILKAEFTSNEQMVSRFEREALASTHIESPHVVQVFDAGVLEDGRPYLVMEFLTGEDLGTRIMLNGRLPIMMAVDLCIQVARGLTAAHASGVFHRDMKPNNIVIARTKSGRQVAKIVDFGISKLLDTSKESISTTKTGTVLGSPVYMSPEQARGSKSTDHRSDIYSLGVVLFECLTGTTPHTADGFNELLFKIVLEETPSVRSYRPEVDEELASILARMLAKTPEVRVQTAAEVESLLVDWFAKNGGKLSDSQTEGGQRIPPDLAASPVAGLRPASSGRLLAAKSAATNLGNTVPVATEKKRAPSDPSLTPLVEPDAHESQDAHIAAAVAQTEPAPKPSGSLEASLTPSSSSSSTNSAPNRSRRGYMIAAALGLVVVVGGLAAATSRGGSPTAPASSGLVEQPTGLPASASATTQASAATEATAATAAASASSAMASASASASSTSSSASAMPSASAPTAGGRPGVPAITGVPGHGGPTRPVPSVPAVAGGAKPNPAASSTAPASVGGRTIRTDL